nr:tetratricopeptide repeat protein [Aquibacillus saliphilus]
MIDSNYYKYLSSPKLECYYLILKGTYLLKTNDKTEYKVLHEQFIEPYLKKETIRDLPTYIEKAVYYYYGLFYFKNYDFSKSIDSFLNLKNTTTSKEIKAITSYNMSIIYKHLCDYPKAIEIIKEAIDYYSSLNKEYDLALSLNLLGSLHRETRNYKNALIAFNESKRIAEKNSYLDILGYIYHNFGLLEKNEGNIESAIILFISALKVKEGSQKADLLITYREIIACKLIEKNTKEAQNFYWVANLLTEDEEDYHKLLYVFNDYYLLAGQDTEDYELNLDKLISFFLITNNYKMLKQCYLKLGEFYYNSKKYKQSADNYYKSIKLLEE